MKKFVILSYSISGMGGGQMYQYNKLSYMKKLGYQTYILYAVPGEIVIKEIMDVAEVKNLDDLNRHPLVVGKKKVNEVVRSIVNFLGRETSDVIIECNNKTTSLWGEILAKELQGFSY